MKSLKVGGHTFDWGTRTYVMGILNVTPDSFSGDGLLGPRAAVFQGRELKGSTEWGGRGGGH